MISSEYYLSIGRKLFFRRTTRVPVIEKIVVPAFKSGLRFQVLLSVFACATALAQSTTDEPVQKEVDPTVETLGELHGDVAAKGKQPLADGALTEELQEANAALMEEVLVTGIRASMRGAIERKKMAGTMMDAIVAEDISQFPDKNVGEALQRITGVQLTRSFGEGSGINIRGMEANLNRTEIDGVSVLGTGGSRSVDFGNMASELVKVLTVIKGSEARLTEGGVGGTVQLEMRKPNEFDEHLLSFAFEEQYNDLSRDYSPKGNLTGVYKINDDLGVMVNFNASDKHTMIHALRNTQWNRWADYDQSEEKSVVDERYSDATSAEDCLASYGPNGSNDQDALTDCQRQWWDFAPENPRYGIWERQEKRTSYNFGVGWAVNDSLSTYMDYTYNERDKRAHDLNLSLDLGGERGVDADTVVIDEAHNVRSFTSSNAGISNRTLDFSWLQRSTQLKTGLEFSHGPWGLDAILAHSTSKQDIDSRDTHITQSGVAGVAVTLDREGAPEFDLTSGYRYQSPDVAYPPAFEQVNVNDPASYNARARYKYAPVIEQQEEDSVKLDLVYQFDEGVFTNIRSGIRYAQQSMDAKTYLANIIRDVGTEYTQLDTGELVEFTEDDLANLITGATRESPEFFPNFDLGVGTIGSYQAVDTAILIERLTALEGATVNRNQLSPRNGAYYIEEKAYAAYLQTDFETYIGGMRLWGNTGVRYVVTEVASEGDVTITTKEDPVGADGEILRDDEGNPLAPIDILSFEGRDSSQGEYTDILPSLNLNLTLIPDELNLFFGASRVMARPRITEMNINASCTKWETELSREPGSTIRNTCDAGNPDLDPYRADQYDLAFMWYPDEDSLVSAAIFTKKLTSYLGPKTTSFDEDFFKGGNNGGVLYDVRQKTNIEGVTTRGIEFQARTLFSMLPPPFNRVGGEVNYTRMSAENVPYVSSLDGSQLPLLGQSRDSYNLTGFYESERLMLRLAYNYRSQYLAKSADRSGAPVYVDAAGHLDGKISYQLGDGFSIYADARNLLSEVKLESAGEGRLSNLEWAGRTYALGFSYQY